MAQVPLAPFGAAHSFHWQKIPMSSPIMNVLLVPSLIAVSDIFPPRASARQKIPSPNSSPFWSRARFVPLVGLRYAVLKLVSLVTPKKSVPQLDPLTPL